ncbi:UDP-glucosyltransferase 2-like [Sitodiplosis mosellana]|uniref:UDP-glucosyltransferase 2-like n=1 Tax=Sitodiplosis mosellana TaxID=263140 RepID=UPI002444E92E|nr:UDP-glucosyltransferase 2-like [Sitodiplosis mosellana]
MRVKTLMLLVLCVTSSTVNSYNILGVLQSASKSHYIIGHAIMKALAQDGHHVTVLTPFIEKHPIPNYEEVYLERSVSDGLKEVRSGNYVNYNNLHFWDLAKATYDVSTNWTRSAIRSENFQNFLLQNRHFDVVIVEVFVGDALLSLGQYYNAPVIGFSTTVPSKWTSDLVGLSPFASHVPNILCGFSDKMNFWQRVYNSLSYWYEDIATELYYRPKQQKFMEAIWWNRTDVPTFNEVLQNVPLVFVNSHVTYATPQPLAPNLIEIGGIHVNETAISLNEDVQTFLNGAKDGAIFFSLGSNIKLSKIPSRQKAIIANAFAEFPKMKILIKNEGHFPIPSHNSSDMVLVRDWFNQQEILAHPNLKLFCTHGGLLSTIETVYYGKPAVGIPVLYDQYLNMALAESKGYAVTVSYEQLDEQNLKSSIRSALKNPSYARTAKLLSEQFHGQLNTPMKTVIHWVKHVAKYKGASQLRSTGIDMPFYIYYNLDCYAFLIFICTSAIFIAYKLIKTAFRALSHQASIKIKTS